MLKDNLIEDTSVTVYQCFEFAGEKGMLAGYNEAAELETTNDKQRLMLYTKQERGISRVMQREVL
jgi:hypothetical protein